MGLAAHTIIIIIEQLIVIISFLSPSLHSIIIQTLEKEHPKPVPTSSNLAYVWCHMTSQEGKEGEEEGEEKGKRLMHMSWWP